MHVCDILDAGCADGAFAPQTSEPHGDEEQHDITTTTDITITRHTAHPIAPGHDYARAGRMHSQPHDDSVGVGHMARCGFCPTALPSFGVPDTRCTPSRTRYVACARYVTRGRYLPCSCHPTLDYLALSPCHPTRRQPVTS